MEYSISASVMILAIAVQVGLTDVYVLCCLFALIFATNILGLIAEVLCPVQDAWVPHGLAWITCLVAYAPLLDAYVASMQCSDLSPPGYANVIVFLQFVLFMCFGLVQLYSLCYARPEPPGFLRASWEHTRDVGVELTYTGLSITAKTLLAWLVMGPTLVNAQKMF